MNAPVKLPMWNLDSARTLINQIQLGCRAFQYHVALGGGVLNKGESTKDLDLYFLTLDNGQESDHVGLLKWLEGMFGKSNPLPDENDNYLPSHQYKYKVKLCYEGKRIDAFILYVEKPTGAIDENTPF